MIQFFDGGPIIAFQIENEYGSYYSDDVKYMEHLKSVGKFSVLKHFQTTVLHNFITTKTFQRNLVKYLCWSRIRKPLKSNNL